MSVVNSRFVDRLEPYSKIQIDSNVKIFYSDELGFGGRGRNVSEL